VSKKPQRRTDYWDDPRAPAPTSRKPSASVVLRNHRGELLLLRRVGSGLWTIPTGALKKKETVTACAIRECREETGLAVELTGLVGVFSDPRHRIAYPDGEVRVPVNVCFYGQPVDGELATDSESDEAAWVAPEDLDDYDIHPAIRRRISHALNGTIPHVDLTAAGREAGLGWGGSGVSDPCLAVPGLAGNDPAQHPATARRPGPGSSCSASTRRAPAGSTASSDSPSPTARSPSVPPINKYQIRRNCHETCMKLIRG
jgi:ADP-ribose pyrophosphatase YjhB (NUDIX family)